MRHGVFGQDGSPARVCPREEEVTGALLRGGPRLDAELQSHVDGCPICGDVAHAVALMRADAAAMSARFRPPAAGQVWWRAAVRARMEAAQSAAQPVGWVQGIAGACAVGAACATGVLVWPSARRLVARFAERATGLDGPSLESLVPVVTTIEQTFIYVLALAACIVLAPLAVLLYGLSDSQE